MRISSGIALLAVVFVIVGLLWSVFGTSSGGMDRTASRRIDQLCGFEKECKVRIGDLLDGDWDTFYEFGVGISQAEVDSVLGTNSVHTGDLQRLLALTRKGAVVSSQLEDDGVEAPLNHEIEFDDEHHREQQWVAIKRNTWLRVNRYATTNGGTSYVLSNDAR